MKFKRVLREALRFWPSRIAISDGKLVAGGGGLFPQLSGQLEVAQAHAQAWSEAHQLMVWALFCALHKDAVTSFKAGRGWIAKSDLDMRYLRQKYQESLFASGSHYPRQMLRVHIGVSWRPGRDPGSLSSRFTSASCRLWLGFNIECPFLVGSGGGSWPFAPRQAKWMG
jgi:hypothetical protein